MVVYEHNYMGMGEPCCVVMFKIYYKHVCVYVTSVVMCVYVHVSNYWIVSKYVCVNVIMHACVCGNALPVCVCLCKVCLRVPECASMCFMSMYKMCSMHDDLSMYRGMSNVNVLLCMRGITSLCV